MVSISASGLTRELIVSNVTANPTRQWLTQQFRNCFQPEIRPPQVVAHDNDGIFGQWLGYVLEEFGTESLPIPLGQPWWNGCVERFHRSLKSEVMRRLPIIDESHARELCYQYQHYYNNHRTHQGLNGATPKRLTGHKMVMSINPNNFKIEKIKKVADLITVFCLAA